MLTRGTGDEVRLTETWFVWAARSFSVLYLKKGRVIALDCVNAVKDFVQGRKRVETGMTIDSARLAGVATPLKEMTSVQLRDMSQLIRPKSLRRWLRGTGSRCVNHKYQRATYGS